MDTRKELYKNIVLSGANTMFPGFASRFKTEIKDLYVKINLKHSENKTIKINIDINDSPRRKISVFIGAAVLAQTYNNPNYDSYWISQSDWSELGGENAILKKCKNVIL